MKIRVILAIILAGSMACCFKPSAKIDHRENGKIKLGAAISYSLLESNAQYRNTIIQNFQSVSFTNELKMKNVQREEGVWDFSRVDSMLHFARNNNLQVHGHTLVWHHSVPDWLGNYSGDSAKLEEIMKQHIFQVISHCKGKVVSWDVVNEAISDTSGNYFRGTIWSRNLGEGFIERAFHYAHEADPDALLFYNEYGTEQDTLKFSKTMRMIKNLQQRGVPVHGIGFQMHTQLGWPPVELIDSLVKVAASTGLLIHFSEVDVSVNGLFNSTGYLTSLEDDMLMAQTVRYQKLAEIYHSIPVKQQFALTTWGVHDGSTWLRDHYVRNKSEWPLLFDDHFNPKPAFFAIQKIVSHEGYYSVNNH
jgi:endo-1,4-beta-xylanase